MTEAIRYRMETGGVAVIELDIPGKKVNVLSTAAMERLAQTIDELGSVPELRGVVVASTKESGFVAGADIEEIQAIGSAEEGEQKAARGQAIFASLADLEVPVVAALDGACLGGGAELALACDYRVATDDRATRIGLPEVNLGILPGFGGTQRLPRLVGIAAALDLILSGRSVDGESALGIGLVDRIVPREALIDEAVRWATVKPKRRDGPQRAARGLRSRLLEGNPLGRWLLFRQARGRVLAKTKGFYPAPLRVLDAVRKGTSMRIDDGLVLEARFLGELVVTEACRNLVWLYRASNAAKAGSGGGGTKRPVSAAKPVAEAGEVDAAPGITRVGVVGAGVMGSGIAQLASYRNIEVTLKDVDHDALDRGMDIVRQVYQGAVRKGKLDRKDADARAALIAPTIDAHELADADIVIEAAIEDMGIKRAILREFEGLARDTAIFATNTSSLSVTELATTSKHPERVAGMHFFNPVHRMPLVEVIAGERTSDASLMAIVGLASKLGKVPIVVKDSPGFLVNRILGPYLNEACLLLEEGTPIEQIDTALTEFGMPMGPLRLLDEIGLDVASKVQRVLRDAYTHHMRVSPVLDDVVEAGRLGPQGGTGVLCPRRPHRAGRSRRRGSLRSDRRRRPGERRRDPRPYDLVDAQRGGARRRPGNRSLGRGSRSGHGCRRRLSTVPGRAVSVRASGRLRASHRPARGHGNEARAPLRPGRVAEKVGGRDTGRAEPCLQRVSGA